MRLSELNFFSFVFVFQMKVRRPCRPGEEDGTAVSSRLKAVKIYVYFQLKHNVTACYAAFQGDIKRKNRTWTIEQILTSVFC